MDALDNAINIFADLLIDFIIDFMEGVTEVVTEVGAYVISFCLFAAASSAIVGSLMLLTL